MFCTLCIIIQTYKLRQGKCWIPLGLSDVVVVARIVFFFKRDCFVLLTVSDCFRRVILVSENFNATFTDNIYMYFRKLYPIRLMYKLIKVVARKQHL